MQAHLSDRHPSGERAHGKHWLGDGREGLIPCSALFGTMECRASVSPTHFAQGPIEKKTQRKCSPNAPQLWQKVVAVSPHSQMLIILLYEDKNYDLGIVLQDAFPSVAPQSAVGGP